MIGFLAVFAINIGLAILGRLLQPKIKRSERPSLDIPFAEEGTPIPIVYGTQEVNPTLMWYGDKEKLDGLSNSTKYRAKMQFSLCIGPVNKILDIQFGGRSLALATETPIDAAGFFFALGYTTSVPFPLYNPNNGNGIQFYVNDLYMFGGPKEGGGVAGMASVMFGGSDQVVDSLTEQAHEEGRRSTYPNVAILSLGQKFGSYPYPIDNGQFEFCSNTGQPQPIKVILECIPYALLGSIDAARIGIDANPAEVLFDLLTHRLRGSGQSESMINKTKFLAKANQYRDEGLGISLTVGNSMSLEEIDAVIDDICKYCDAVVFQNVTTGLFDIEDARGDEPTAGLLEINKDNSSNFKMTPGQWSDTYNSFKLTYRSFNDGTNGHVDDEVVTTDFNGGWDGEQSYYLQGKNISNLVLTDVSNGHVLTLNDDYKIESAARGKIQITDEGTGLVADGHEIHAEYDADPTFMGFRDAVETAKSQMNRQITKDVRTLEVEYPFFTQKQVAQRYVNRLRRQNSVPVKRASWTMDASGYNLVPCQTVKINRPELNLVDFRMVIMNIDYGTLEQGFITVEAAQDVFGDDYELSTDDSDDPVIDTTLPVAPAMSLYCITPGAIRIGLSAGNEAFNIEVERSDDAIGTGATIISPAGGYPGSTDFIDDPWPDGTTKYYRSRLIRTGYQAGPYTARASCTAAAGDPGDPVCTVPTWTLSKSETSLVGTAGINVTDPQGRLLSVEAKYKKGSDPTTEYTTLAFPYTQDVDLVSSLTSTVWFRVTYTGCDGLPLVYEEQVDFIPPILYSLSAKFDIDGNLLADFAHSGGSIRIAGAIEATPADAAVDATTAINSSIGTTSTLAGPATAGQTGTVKAVVYSGAGGTGRKTAYVVNSALFGSTSGGGGGSAVLLRNGIGFRLRHDELNTWVVWPVKSAATVVQVEVQNEDGSAVTATVELERSPAAGFPAWADITGGNDVVITADDRLVDEVLSGWTAPDKTLIDGDVIRARLTATDALDGDLLVVLVFEEEATIDATVSHLVPVGGVFRTQGERLRFTVEEDGTIIGTEIQGDANGMTGTIEVWYSPDVEPLAFTQIGELTLDGSETGARNIDGDLASFAGNEVLANGGTLELRFVAIGGGGTEISAWIVKKVGEVVGGGGYTGTVPANEIPRVAGGMTLATSGLKSGTNAIENTKGWKRKVRVITADDGMLADDHIIAIRGTVTLTMLDVATYEGREILVINDGADDVTITMAGTDLIAVGEDETSNYVLGAGLSVTLLALTRSPTPNVWRVI